MYLFVYGTLKRGFQNHHILEDSIFICDGITINKFIMYSNGFYPMIVPEKKSKYSGYVKGEIYKIKDKLIKKIDEFEDVPEEYIRIEENIRCVNTMEVIKCFLYISSKEKLHYKLIKPDSNKIIQFY